MPALTTTDQLLDLVRKSKLVDGKLLDSFLQSAESLPAEPRALAKLLLQQGLITSFQASQLLVGKYRGFFVANGKYKLLELLGIGGMGKVYLCEHVRMKRLIAIKVLPTDKLDEPTSLERFEREARASGALDHPNLVRAHDLDSDQDGKLHFLVMEYIDGSSLHDIVKKLGPMDVARACHYVSQAASGLQHAHDCARLVHRDVKPGNILLDRTGTVKLLDMGLARFFLDDSANPLTKRFEKNSVLGTADYLAPEQAEDSSSADIRADIYGLGATFYFLLTGKPPFDHGTISEKLLAHQHKSPEPIRTVRPDVPQELVAVIARMMAKKPAQRYQEPADVVEALQPWTDQPIEPPAEEEMPRLCPALVTRGPAGLPGATSGSGSLSGRMHGRNGPRSTAVNRHSTVRIPRVTPKVSSFGLIGVGFGFAALLAAIAGLIWYVSQPPANSRIGPQIKSNGTPARLSAGEMTEALPLPVENQFYVSANPQIKAWSVGRPDVADTLGEALAKAGPNAKVIVLDPAIEGQLRIDGAILAGITIEGRSANGQAVVWRASEGATVDVPLLTLQDAGAARIHGIVFDGGKRLDTLIRVQGVSTGMRLEDCQLTDALKTSIVITGATAAKDRPLTIEQVRFTSVRDYRNERTARTAAIQCLNDSHPGGPLALAVRLCRLEGSFQAGVRIECPIDAELRLNRIYSTLEGPSDAVSIRIPDTEAVKLSLASNTVAGCANLLRLDRLPSKISGSTFLLRSNLMVDGDAFVEAGDGADLATAKLLFAGGSGNVAKADHCNRGLAVLEKVKASWFLIGTDPSEDRFFLRYDRHEKTSRALFTAGAGGEPAGVPPAE